MTAQRWARLKEIFAQVVILEPAEHDRFLTTACGDDVELLAQARRLLASHIQSESFLSGPAFAAGLSPGESLPLFAEGQVVGERFRIVRFIARGGVGEVYEAEDLTLGSRVALKTIQAQRSAAHSLELLKQEVLSARQITHPNVGRVYDLGEYRTDGHLVRILTMELLDGPTLSAYLKEHGPLDARDALPLAEQLCAGLQAAHDAGIVHGDFKPGNVILVRGPHGLQPVITDFGLAQGSSGSFPRGTPGYMAPEQVEGNPATPASDIYALGLVISRMAGQPKTRTWKRTIDRCLDADPRKRPARPTDVARALRGISPVVRGAAVASLAVVLTAGGLAVFRTPPAPVTQPSVTASNPLAVDAPTAVNPAIPPPAPSPVAIQPGQLTDQRIWNQPVQSYGSVSADGRYVTYTDYATGNLGIRDLQTGTSRLLTRDGTMREGARAEAVLSAISRDNSQVVYLWRQEHPGLITLELRLASTREGESKLLLTARTGGQPGDLQGFSPWDWSADGKKLLGSRSILPPRGSTSLDFTLAWLDVADGTWEIVHKLKTRPLRVSLSPDGRFIAYDDLDDSQDNRSIYLLDTLSGQHTLATPDTIPDDKAPIWTHDGSALLYFSTRTGAPTMWGIAVKNGKPASLEFQVQTTPVTPLGMTQSGSLYYSSFGTRRNIYTAEVDSNLLHASEPRLAVNQFVNSNFQAQWSPDGNFLAYQSTHGILDNSSLIFTAPRYLDVYSDAIHTIRSVPASFQTFLTPPAWTPGSQSVVVGAGRSTDRGAYAVDLAGGGVKLLQLPRIPLLQSLYSVLDSEYAIVYLTLGSAVAQPLERFDLAAGNRIGAVRTSSDRERMRWFAVSPDKSKFAFVLEDTVAKQSSLEVMPIDGGPSVQLFREASDRLIGTAGIAWSPDQRFIVFVRAAPAELDRLDVAFWRIPSAGGDPLPIGIALRGVLDAMSLAYPSIHPDGRRFTYTRNDRYSELHVLEHFLPTEN